MSEGIANKSDDDDDDDDNVYSTQASEETESEIYTEIKEQLGQYIRTHSYKTSLKSMTTLNIPMRHGKVCKTMLRQTLKIFHQDI
jgi:hypothetical protein